MDPCGTGEGENAADFVKQFSFFFFRSFSFSFNFYPPAVKAKTYRSFWLLFLCLKRIREACRVSRPSGRKQKRDGKKQYDSCQKLGCNG